MERSVVGVDNLRIVEVVAVQEVLVSLQRQDLLLQEYQFHCILKLDGSRKGSTIPFYGTWIRWISLEGLHRDFSAVLEGTRKEDYGEGTVKDHLSSQIWD